MATTTAAAKPPPSAAKNGYLILYNAVSAMLWLTVLGRIVAINAVRGPHLAYPAVGEFCKWTQTLAGMEVLHSLFGKSSLIYLGSKNQPPTAHYTIFACRDRRTHTQNTNTHRHGYGHKHIHTCDT
jgi:hypothetical protein